MKFYLDSSTDKTFQNAQIVKPKPFFSNVNDGQFTTIGRHNYGMVNIVSASFSVLSTCITYVLGKRNNRQAHKTNLRGIGLMNI